MRFILLSVISLFLMSCSTQRYHVEEMSDYSYKHYEEIQEHIFKLVDNHKEYSADQKAKLKSVLKESLDKSRELKIQENKSIQILFDSYIAENTDMNKVNKIKSQMTSLYEQKEDLIQNTADKIKKIVGINEVNHVLTMEISPFMQ